MVQSALKREAFIPLNRRDLVELCLAGQHFSAGDAQHFREFCQILSAYFHFQFHGTLESIKANYAPFNPNVDVQSQHAYDGGQLKTMQHKFVEDFQHLLDKSNYMELSKGTLRRALEERSLVALKTDVDFDDFQQLLCYYRGDSQQEIEEKNWLRQPKTRTISIFERIVLLIQFKDKNHFHNKNIDTESLNYTPGKMYLYFYRDVPKYDLELLFPNVKISMTWKDRLMLLIPAVGAGIAIVIRVLPQLFLIVLAVLIILKVDLSLFPAWMQRENTQATTDTLAILVATLSMVVALGGFGFKQYMNYKSKKIQFQKNVTEALFFRSIANHSAVFQLLIDVAEEEECKEVILAYFHLLISPKALSADELDQTIEEWMTHHLQVNVDFDIQDALDKLERLKVMTNDGINRALVQEVSSPEAATIMDSDGGSQPLVKRYKATDLPLAKEIIDRLWDDAFAYNIP